MDGNAQIVRQMAVCQIYLMGRWFTLVQGEHLWPVEINNAISNTNRCIKEWHLHLNFYHTPNPPIVAGKAVLWPQMIPLDITMDGRTPNYRAWIDTDLWKKIHPPAVERTRIRPYDDEEYPQP